jgi:hypothetical protein
MKDRESVKNPLLAVALLMLPLLALMAPSSLQEKVTLGDPVHTDPGATEFRLATLFLDATQPVIRAVLTEVVPGSFNFQPNGKTLACEYYGDDAQQLLVQLNTMNFSTVSLQKRVIQTCVKDKKIPPGTVSGTPSTFTATRTPATPPGTKPPCPTPPCKQ